MAWQLPKSCKILKSTYFYGDYRMHRLEIDGLRALAVIPVVLYHLGLGFPGGWVGVDVFFVISGFLITSLLVRDLDASAFSLRNFWERRARRILPAAIVMSLACLFMGWFLLAPDDYKALGESAAKQAIFVSNFYFWQQTGYFSVPAETQPLLHTWSLAVEEQFYIVFPFLLSLCWHRGKRFTVIIFSIISLLSFAVSWVGVYRFPDATFFLLPSRAWEMALGSLLALFGGMNAGVRQRWLREILSWTGLFAILIPMFYYTKETRFPGPGALSPCLGALAVIAGTANGGSSLGRILSLRVPVFIGLISYSLYLWHWPMIVFAKQISAEDVSVASRIMILGFSFIVAILSWYFIETPFRKQKSAGEPGKWVPAALGALCLLVFSGLVIFSNDGAPGRFSDELNQIDIGRKDRDATLLQVHNLTGETLSRDGLPVLSRGHAGSSPELLVWGDSHCGAILPGIRSVCEEFGIQAYSATRDSTVPLLNTYKSNGAKTEYIEFNDAVFAFAKSKKIKHALLVGSWAACVSPKRYDNDILSRRLLRSPECDFKNQHSREHALSVFQDSIKDTVARLQGTNVQVWIMKEVPTHESVVPTALAKAVMAGRDPNSIGIKVEQYRDQTREISGIFDRLKIKGVTFLDPLPFFLTKDGFCRTYQDGSSLYYDTSHLTVKGALFLKPMFLGLAGRIIAERSNFAKNSR